MALFNAGANPRTILEAMRANLEPGQAVTACDVYNACVHIWASTLGGKTPIQALFEQLEQESFFISVCEQLNTLVNNIYVHTNLMIYGIALSELIWTHYAFNFCFWTGSCLL